MPRIIRFASASLCTLLIAVSLVETPAGAAEDAPVDCTNATSTVEMNVCADREFEQADAELNAVYQRALGKLPQLGMEKPFDAKSWETALRKSQRAWIAFRDAECREHVPMFWTGGTGTTVAVISCLTDKTKARTRELREHYEGDN